MKVFLPYNGEFGHLIMWHAPQVQAAAKGCDDVVLVCCECGNEILYPSADIYHNVERYQDSERRESADIAFIEKVKRDVESMYAGDLEFVEPSQKAPREYFVPEPEKDYGSPCDWQCART